MKAWGEGHRQNFGTKGRSRLPLNLVQPLPPAPHHLQKHKPLMSPGCSLRQWHPLSIPACMSMHPPTHGGVDQADPRGQLQWGHPSIVSAKGKAFYSNILSPFPFPYSCSISERVMGIVAKNAEPSHHLLLPRASNTGAPRNTSNHSEK